MTRRQFFQSATLLAAGATVAKSTTQTLRDTAPFRDLPPSAWRNARQNGLVMILPEPSGRPSREARIAEGEPGQPLVVLGVLYAPDGATPAPGVTVYAYNTDAEGYYGAGHAEYPPRLHGWMLTDNSGRFELHTIRPGHYPHARIPAHIHFSLWGGGYPPQWVDELRFADGPFITEAMRTEAAGQGTFTTIQPVMRGDDGTWHCKFQIRAGHQCNFH